MCPGSGLAGARGVRGCSDHEVLHRRVPLRCTDLLAISSHAGTLADHLSGRMMTRLSLPRVSRVRRQQRLRFSEGIHAFTGDEHNGHGHAPGRTCLLPHDADRGTDRSLRSVLFECIMSLNESRGSCTDKHISGVIIDAAHWRRG